MRTETNNLENDFVADMVADFKARGLMPQPKPASTHPVIAKIIAMDKSWMTEKENFYLDLFLLSFYTGGSSISKLADIKTYELQDIEVITVTKDGREIFNKYIGLGYDEYVLPIYSHKHITSQQKDGKTKRLSAQINQLLHTLSNKLKLSQVVTFKSAQQFMLEHLVDCNIPANEAVSFTGVSFDRYVRCWQNMKGKI